MLEIAAAESWIAIRADEPLSDDPVVSSTQAKTAKALPSVIPELREFNFLGYQDDKRHLDHDELGPSIEFMQAISAVLGLRPHPFLDSNILFEFGVSMDQPCYKKEWKRIVTAITEEVAQGFSRQAPIFSS